MDIRRIQEQRAKLGSSSHLDKCNAHEGSNTNSSWRNSTSESTLPLERNEFGDSVLTLVCCKSRISTHFNPEVNDSTCNSGEKFEDLNSQMNVLLVSMDDEVKDTEYYREKYESAISQLKGQISKWESIFKFEKNRIFGNLKGDILANIGNSNLLISGKIKQFANLVDQTDPASKIVNTNNTQVSDLHGFWDLVIMQLDGLFAEFKRFDETRANKYRQVTTKRDQMVKNPNLLVKKKPVLKAETKSKFLDLIKTKSNVKPRINETCASKMELCQKRDIACDLRNHPIAARQTGKISNGAVGKGNSVKYHASNVRKSVEVGSNGRRVNGKSSAEEKRETISKTNLVVGGQVEQSYTKKISPIKNHISDQKDNVNTSESIGSDKREIVTTTNEVVNEQVKVVKKTHVIKKYIAYEIVNENLYTKAILAKRGSGTTGVATDPVKGFTIKSVSPEKKETVTKTIKVDRDQVKDSPAVKNINLIKKPIYFQIDNENIVKKRSTMKKPPYQIENENTHESTGNAKRETITKTKVGARKQVNDQIKASSTIDNGNLYTKARLVKRGSVKVPDVSDQVEDTPKVGIVGTKGRLIKKESVFPGVTIHRVKDNAAAKNVRTKKAKPVFNQINNGNLHTKATLARRKSRFNFKVTDNGDNQSNGSRVMGNKKD